MLFSKPEVWVLLEYVGTGDPLTRAGPGKRRAGVRIKPPQDFPGIVSVSAASLSFQDTERTVDNPAVVLWASVHPAPTQKENSQRLLRPKRVSQEVSLSLRVSSRSSCGFLLGL